jgi:twinkle protein
VQIANYHRDGKIIGQKLRFPNKDFKWISMGHGKNPLYGQNLWKEGGKKLVITEGEIDAISVSQVQNHKWPVVSIPHGANNAVKSIKSNIEWIESFDEVIFMFDMDDPGQEAALACAKVLTPGKAKIATLAAKDANALLVAGRGDEIIQAMWNAKTYRPDGILAANETWEAVSRIIDTESTPYPWPHFNSKSYGMRPGEIVMVTAGSGIGKSSMCRELAYFLFCQENEKVGYIGLEESVAQTARSFMSLEAGVPLHLRPQALSKERQREVWEKVMNHERLHLYDHWGSVDSENLLSRMKYMVKGLGCKWLFLDHISIMISGDEDGDERRKIDNAMTKFRSFVEEVQCGLFIVSHLRKRQGGGRSFEEGGQITLADLRGSGALYQLSDIVVGLERNQQDPETVNIVTVRWLKNRFSGMTGVSGTLVYDMETGRMENGNSEAGDFGFTDHTANTNKDF